MQNNGGENRGFMAHQAWLQALLHFMVCPIRVQLSNGQQAITGMT
jgi:hypothetical protein